MGLLGGGTLLLLPALVVAFCVAVNKSEKVYMFYEYHVKEWLEWFDPAVTLIDAVSYVFAMVAFKIIKKWDAVFYDCFTPLSIWLESGYSFCMLIQLLYFIGDYPKNYARISVESMGLGIQMASIFTYVMLKSALDRSFDPQKANMQNLSALLFFVFSELILIIALDTEGHSVAPPGKGFWPIAVCVAVAAMALQCIQLYCAIHYRMKEGHFEDDSPDIALVKLVAAVVKVFTQCYYCWLYTSKGYWGSAEKIPLVLMTSFTLGYHAVVAFERYVGPSWLKAVFDRTVSGIIRVQLCITRTSAGVKRRCDEKLEFWDAWCDRKRAEFAARRSAKGEAIRRTWTSSCNWLMGRQVNDPPAAAELRQEQPGV